MKLKNLLLALAFVGFGLTAQAQSVENNASLEERVAQLETKSKVKSFADKYLNLSGYLQAGVSWADNDKTTFYIRRARVSLSGNVAEAKLDYRLQVDMAGTPKICDLYMRYKPFKELGVQLGQFKLPFSLENELYGPTKFEFIEYSYLTSLLVRNDKTLDGIAATGRDLGAQIFGGFIHKDGYSIINYNLGVFNGSGINGKDHNKSKDIIGRITIKPFKGFSVSGSYMYGETKFVDSLEQRQISSYGTTCGAVANEHTLLFQVRQRTLHCVGVHCSLSCQLTYCGESCTCFILSADNLSEQSVGNLHPDRLMVIKLPCHRILSFQIPNLSKSQNTSILRF